MSKPLFSVIDMEKCFDAGRKFETDINQPDKGEYILPKYDFRMAIKSHERARTFWNDFLLGALAGAVLTALVLTYLYFRP